MRKHGTKRKIEQGALNERLKDLLPQVLAIAETAGREIRKIYESADFGTTYKEDSSPLTLADKRAHNVIAEGLSRLTPDYPVLSEESQAVSYATRQNWQTFWLVDPLDGTKEFIRKNGQFTVNIALISAREPVLGVVHAPAVQKTYFAAQSLGAFRREAGAQERLRAADYRQGSLIIVASRSHAGDKLKGLLSALNPAKILHIGSALKLCMVAEGEAHFYPRLGPTMEWDTAAAHCIVNEAGGRVFTLDGGDLKYNRPDMTNPEFVVCGNPPFPWHQYRHLF